MADLTRWGAGFAAKLLFFALLAAYGLSLWHGGQRPFFMDSDIGRPASVRITEDDPRWNCHTMGNKICGNPHWDIHPDGTRELMSYGN